LAAPASKGWRCPISLERGWGIAAVDVDNDGLLDLAAVGENNGSGEIRLLRNMGGERFSDVSEAAGLKSIALVKPRALLTGDFDGDGDTDILVTQNGGKPLLLRNDGGNKRTSCVLRFRDSTIIEVRSAPRLKSLPVRCVRSGGVVVVGIPRAECAGDRRWHGFRARADIVRVLWPSGCRRTSSTPGSPPPSHQRNRPQRKFVPAPVCVERQPV
jgi:hypothetical protein